MSHSPRSCGFGAVGLWSERTLLETARFAADSSLPAPLLRYAERMLSYVTHCADSAALAKLQ